MLDNYNIMSLTKEDSLRLKKCELEIFRHFISVCDQLGLRYYAVAGTLIGAVRHNGFIPWDDDIDIAMPRKDYQVLMQKGQSLLPRYYFLQNYHTDREFLCNFAKIRDTRTTYIDADMCGKDICYGVFIDIFPIDYYPEERLRAKWLDIKNKAYELRRVIAYLRPKRHGNPLKELVKKILVCTCRVICPDAWSVIEKRDKLFMSTPTSKYVRYYSCGLGKREILKAEWFNATTNLPFEGIQVCVPKDFDVILTHIYGDYMKLPPVEARVGHHYVTAFDLDHPYTEYLN